MLKDASSTAVYGARGTFGVILLTTKKPQKGSAKVTYNGTFTFYKRATKPQMVTNGYDYTTSFLESYVNAFGKDPSNINNVFKFSRTWYNELARRNSDPRMRNGASTTATSTNTSATPTGTTYSTRTIRPDTSTTSA